MLACVWHGLLVVLSLAASLAVCEAALRLADTRYEQAAEPPLRDYYWKNTHPHPDAKKQHRILYNRFGNRQHRDFSERDLCTGVHIAFFGFRHQPQAHRHYAARQAEALRDVLSPAF